MVNPYKAADAFVTDFRNMEYVLKRSGYLRNDKEVAEADWDLFAKCLGLAFFDHVGDRDCEDFDRQPTPAASGQHAMVAPESGAIGQRRATHDQWRLPGAQQLHPWREVHGWPGGTMGPRYDAYHGGARGVEGSDELTS